MNSQVHQTMGEQRGAAPNYYLDTAQAWVSDYLQERAAAGLSVETMAHYGKHLNAYVRWIGEQTKPLPLDASSVFGFLTDQAKLYSANSVHHRGETLVTFCYWLAHTHKITLEEADLIARTKNALEDVVGDSGTNTEPSDKRLVLAAPAAQQGLPPLAVVALALALDEYIKSKQAKQQATDIYKSRLHWFLRWLRYVHEDPAATLSAPDFMAFGTWLGSIRSKRQNRHLGEPMQREILKRLRSALRWSFRNGHLAHDYASWIPRLMPPAAAGLEPFEDGELDMEVAPSATGAAGGIIVPNISTVNLRVWFELYLTAKRALGLSTRTLAWYSYHIGAYLRWVEAHNGVLPLAVVTLEHYLASRRGEVSPFTLRGIFRALYAFCTWLVKRRYIAATETPFLYIEPPKVPSKRMKYVTVNEFMQIYQSIRGERWTDRRDRVLLYILLYSGLRASEVIGLGIADVERGEGVIHVRRGKGNKSRIVPYHPDLPGLLDAYLQVRPQVGDGKVLFLSARGPDDGQPMPYRGLSEMLRRRCKAAGVKLSLHAFRHGFAMWALNNGVPMSALASMMGHHSVTVTESTYARWVTSAINREYSIALERLTNSQNHAP